MGGSEQFTRLEKSVLAAICEASPQMAGQLGEFIAKATVRGRENTGFGFFTSLEVVKDRPPLSATVSGLAELVWIDDAPIPMSFILHTDGGYPSCLEGWQATTSGGAHLDLRQVDLATATLVDEGGVREACGELRKP